MSTVNIEIIGWDKLVAKYGEEALGTKVWRALGAASAYTADRAKLRIAGLHHITGFLLSSITLSQPQKGGDGVYNARVFAKPGGSVYYARFVEEGTGVYGPHKQLIFPKVAKAMSWHMKSVTGKPLKKYGKEYRKWVRGQKPVNYMKNTLKEDGPKIVGRFKEVFSAELQK